MTHSFCSNGYILEDIFGPYLYEGEDFRRDSGQVNSCGPICNLTVPKSSGVGASIHALGPLDCHSNEIFLMLVCINIWTGSSYLNIIN